MQYARLPTRNPSTGISPCSSGTGGRAVFDVRASYRVNRQWTVGLNIGNLFDKTYYAMLGELRRGNYYGEPRSATLVVRGSF